MFAQEVRMNLETIIVLIAKERKKKEENDEIFKAETNGAIVCGFAGFD